MIKRDKALIVEGLNRICADVAALAAILGDTEAPPGKKQATESTPERLTSTEPSGTVSPLPLPLDSNQEHGDGSACFTNVKLQNRPQRSVAPASASQSYNVPSSPTYEQVRAILAEKARTGYRAEVKSLLTKHGVKQLSEITAPEEYAELLKEAEAFVL